MQKNSVRNTKYVRFLCHYLIKHIYLNTPEGVHSGLHMILKLLVFPNITGRTEEILDGSV